MTTLIIQCTDASTVIPISAETTPTYSKHMRGEFHSWLKDNFQTLVGLFKESADKLEAFTFEDFAVEVYLEICSPSTPEQEIIAI